MVPTRPGRDQGLQLSLSFALCSFLESLGSAAAQITFLSGCTSAWHCWHLLSLAAAALHPRDTVREGHSGHPNGQQALGT